MDYTVVSTLASLVMVFSLVYLIVYLRKKKHGRQKERKYRIIFSSVLIILCIAVQVFVWQIA
ncbi:DUF7649 domain-containing protein [Gracilibacillus phocaeensis]|uniref:DUF7649 domain-containing protein n=1 Tax=Gracilibacillus phocaeensis TaxID=2042304 RepID=UPI001030B105|nr:hypothetical protein [Gracilibacillus phocaeensis]